MSISHWEIDADRGTLEYSGNSSSEILHHAVVEFCRQIEGEIEATKATFAEEHREWPFIVEPRVEPRIWPIGYTYWPKRFEMDDDRLYDLLSGANIYTPPVSAVRELIQNAMDACSLRDALADAYSPLGANDARERIGVEYLEPDESHSGPRLVVRDLGVGMTRAVLERYFLKVGRSYYQSAEFRRIHAELRQKDLDFLPVSQFGIGFLSVFQLADRVVVETATWDAIARDVRKHTLTIDGPTRLIHLREEPNAHLGRFEGTRITLHLTRGGGSRGDSSNGLAARSAPPEWREVKTYVTEVCQGLPYVLHLKHVAGEQVTTHKVYPRGTDIDVPPEMKPFAMIIPVDDPQAGLQGQIRLLDVWAWETETADKRAWRSRARGARLGEGREKVQESVLMRGGFRLGAFTWTALPSSFQTMDDGYASNYNVALARIRLTAVGARRREYHQTDLARTRIVNEEQLSEKIFRTWLEYFLKQPDEVPERFITAAGATQYKITSSRAWLEEYNALDIYLLARRGWRWYLREKGRESELAEWEAGRGASLPISSNMILWGALLEAVLPRICTLQSDGLLRYVTPPNPGWESLLKTTRDFVTKPLTWGGFAEFTGAKSKFLFFELGYDTFFNAHYRDRILALFTQEETRILSEIISAHLAGASFSNEQVAESELARRAVSNFGRLRVGAHGRIMSLRDALSHSLARLDSAQAEGLNELKTA
jgi:hypothetical protein